MAKYITHIITAFILLLSLLLETTRIFALDQKQVAELVKIVDERQRNSGDYTSLAYIEQKEKDKSDKIYEARVYRRDLDDKWMILFLKPKAEAGKGYLRLEKNLFLYEPSIGKWERQTERASIVGTGSQRSDFDESRLSEEYKVEYIGYEKLGKFNVHHLKFTALPKIEVSSPILHLWIDAETKNILKRQEHALSNKLLRTIYYPQWQKMFSKSKNAEVFVPQSIRIFDEVEKGNSTVIAIRDVYLDPLPANIFTKAWMESQSR
jgi:hypothetical protein